jgi:hypothetical protein
MRPNKRTERDSDKATDAVALSCALLKQLKGVLGRVYPKLERSGFADLL